MADRLELDDLYRPFQSKPFHNSMTEYKKGKLNVFLKKESDSVRQISNLSLSQVGVKNI